VIGEELYSRMDIEAFLMIVRGFQPAGARAEGRGGEYQVAWGRAWAGWRQEQWSVRWGAF
jgi:hypothetical protein